jgi:hypothetical protein
MVDGRGLERQGGPPDDPADAHLGDAVVELVLGTVDADRRATMASHVLRCAACRREYDELAETVEALLPGVPATQPPLGFDERVLAGLVPERAPGGRRAPRWRWLGVAAAALVALLVPVGVWLTVRDDRGTGGSEAAGDVATLRLTDGEPVGTVSIGDVAGEPVMVVALVGAPPDVGYFCRTHLADGTVTDSESWPAGNGAWIVPLPDGAEVRSVDVMPTGTDVVWSSASFG